MTISKYIYSVYERITGGVKTEEEKLDALETLDHIVRKGAHITEFAMLAAALAWPLRKSGLKGYRLAVASIGLAAIYAMTDEFHQTFVPGRSGELKDVGIDTVGALIGYSIFHL
jgi:VanZ like family.